MFVLLKFFLQKFADFFLSRNNDILKFLRQSLYEKKKINYYTVYSHTLFFVS